jgi:protoporphyrinogen oxidase
VANRRAIIVGAGPAGLTAAYELISRTGIVPVVIERSDDVGGLSRTVKYRGNRMDLGGHRFFSKSDRVMQWWLRMLPLDPAAESVAVIRYHGMERPVQRPAAAEPSTDRVMLLRRRKSRIYYLRTLFDYPISLSLDTLRKLGVARVATIGLSYLRSALFPLRPEKTLEQFVINRFGRKLYRHFFESYTEKVWGVPCSQIGADWGAQRIKGVSVWAALKHAAGKWFRRGGTDLAQKGSETSLIERFLYPKLGPGQMWEETTGRIREMGGEVLTGWHAERFVAEGSRIESLEAVHRESGERRIFKGDYFFSTAPLQEVIASFTPAAPENVREVAAGLVYRDFITVGLLVRGLKIRDGLVAGEKLIRDNWIYVQEPEVRLGRLQIFNNWSPGLVADESKVWLGLEYFCNEGDDLWQLSDEAMASLAAEELARIDVIDAADVLDSTVLRVEKTYPAYFGSYHRFGEIREFLDQFENLFPIGRNGMHRYNNQDHSMLTAMLAVDAIAAGRTDKSTLWDVNTEMEYHEEKTAL